MDKNENNPHLRHTFFQTIKVLILIFALLISFLFALNGRYHTHREGIYFDKWTKTIIFVDRAKEIR